MNTTLQLNLNPNLYLKDPQSTELGKKIIENAINLIDKIGFEAFTFKKLSVSIDSTEASIYRYFENKHRLLVYLITWYWTWVEYNIQFETHNIADAHERLLIALKIIAEKKGKDQNFPDVDEPALQRIVIAESDKTYLTREVDDINKEGLFRGYKSLCKTISSIVSEISPDFKFPDALISTSLEASHQQVFFAKHLPSLSELREADDVFEENFHFLKTLVLNTIR
ncbi:MAG: TetR/AcrR family transcriptional regulator [Cyclobacteriaceae bacterium]|nr:TetR/AcrR family transcriptional regulator [Cyclobacteriaceae bacterium HetDA_MAG_MS6]